MNQFMILSPDKLRANAAAKVKEFHADKRKRALEAKREAAKPAGKPFVSSVKSGSELRVLVKYANGVSFRKALEIADKENLVLASNKRLTNALVETKEGKNLREAFACWTGTMTGYTKPGEKLGKFIEYTDPEDGQKYIFPVPEQYRSEKNMILVAEHPKFTLVNDGKNLVVEASDVAGLANFPKEDGWYPDGEEYDIPCGKECSSDDFRARYLLRAERRVGPVARSDYNHGSDYGRGTDLDDGSSGRFGVIVESPEGGAPAKKEGDS